MDEFGGAEKAGRESHGREEDGEDEPGDRERNKLAGSGDEGLEDEDEEFHLFSPEEEKRVLKKFDGKVVLFIAGLYLLSFLDRSSKPLQDRGSATHADAWRQTSAMRE